MDHGGGDDGVGDRQSVATAAKWVAAYKTIRPTVQRGRLYQIDTPVRDDSSSATMYVA